MRVYEGGACFVSDLLATPSGDVLSTGKGTNLTRKLRRPDEMRTWAPFGASLVNPPSFGFLVFPAELACSSDGEPFRSHSRSLTNFHVQLSGVDIFSELSADLFAFGEKGRQLVRHRPASRQPSWQCRLHTQKKTEVRRFPNGECGHHTERN